MSVLYRKLNLDYCRCSIGQAQAGSWHDHAEYEIFLLISGQGKMLIEQNCYNLHQGNLVIVNNTEKHQDFLPGAAACEGITVHFDPDLLAPFSQTFNLYHAFLDRLPGVQNRLVLTKPQAGKILKHFQRLENLFNNPFYADEVLKYTALIELVFCINRLFLNFSPIAERSNLPENLAAILEYIDDNIQNELSLTILEKTFYIDKSYLGRLFQKYLNVSVHEYIILQRIAKAKELLLDGYSAADAGRHAGFNDYSNFRKMFKKITQVSPVEYVKKQHDENMNAGSVKTYKHKAHSGLADLVVTDLAWSPANPVAGEAVTFRATVKNAGNGPVPVGMILGVGFMVDNITETWSDNYTLGLAPGETVVLTANNGQGGLPTWRAVAGAHQITAHADDIGRLEELSKENNQLVKSLIVQS